MLAEAVRLHVKLNKPRSDGSTLKAHLTQAYKASGKKPKELEESRPPEAFMYLWQWFWELDHTRDRALANSPLSYQEIYYWQKLCEIKLFPWELEALRLMDKAYIKEVNADG